MDAVELGLVFQKLRHKEKKARCINITKSAFVKCRMLKELNCTEWARLRYVQSEIEGMIWEVDEDCDQCLTWKEFQDMYHRCRNDQTGQLVSSRGGIAHCGRIASCARIAY